MADVDRRSPDAATQEQPPPEQSPPEQPPPEHAALEHAALEHAALEDQLASLASGDSEAFEVLAALAEAVFPGRVGIGDPSRLTWPERGHSPRATATPGGAHAATAGGPDREDLEGYIRQSEARFRSLVEQLPAVIFYAALGAGENEAYVSPQIETLLGFTQQEWLTNPLLWYAQLHPDDHDVVIEAFTRGVQTGEPFRAEVRFFSRTGEEVWILGEARLIRDELQRPAYFQGVAFDITMTKRAQEAIVEAQRAKERVKMEAAQMRADAIASHNVRLRQLNKELRAARDAAEAAAHARTTFLTTMSHELRTPLNSVIVLAGLLAEGDLTDAQHDMVRRMRLSSDHLLGLINDVLEFSRLRAGQVELDQSPFDLQMWLDDSLEIIAPRAIEKGLELRRAIAGGVPRILTADQGRLRQVLLNLLGNAVKFTASGYVEVEVGANVLAPGRWEYQCTVRDSGMGIRPEDAATLFDEFRQADSGIAREFGGTGLGLAICKRLCELLGGRIWVAEVGGPGATVCFAWVADADAATAAPAEIMAVLGRVPAGVMVGGGAAPAGALAAPGAMPGGGGPRRGVPGRGVPGGGGPAGGAGNGPGGSGPAGPGPGELGTPRVSVPGLMSYMAQDRAQSSSAGRESRRPSRPATPVPTSDLRVLVAEDNLMNQQVATLLLAAMGHRADVVGNGDEAIAAVRGGPYDVILMDIAMPGTDGISATRAIRALGAEVHQPYIVALTAHAFPGDSESCLEAGMDDYVAKPIDRAQLARALAVGAARKATTGPNTAVGPVSGAPVATEPVGGAPFGGAPDAAALAPGSRPPVSGAPEVPARPDFDPTVPSQLLREFGSEPLGRLAAIFRTEATRLVAVACDAVAANDTEGVERAAHTLKSSAANLGAFALQQSCAELEARSRRGSLEGAAALTTAMVHQLAEALRLLDEILGPAQAS